MKRIYALDFRLGFHIIFSSLARNEVTHTNLADRFDFCFVGFGGKKRDKKIKYKIKKLGYLMCETRCRVRASEYALQR